MLLECLTPLHCGGGPEDPLQDQPVSRDAFGLWRVPGSSLAGILRALSERLDPAMTPLMFGETHNRDKAPRPSLIWCEDVVLLDFDGQVALAKKLAGQEISVPLGPFVRDHVRLDLERDTAIAGGKFDTEIVPAGSRFLMEVRCDGWERELTREEKTHFDRLCAHARAGLLELGGKLGNGYGRYRALECSYTELDLKSPPDMESWLNISRHSSRFPYAGQELPLVEEDACLYPEGLHGTLEMRLACDSPILIAGGSSIQKGEIHEADMLYALSPWLDYARKKLVWRPLVPGSSLKGVMRHGVYRILRDMGLPEEEAAKRLDQLFGFVDGHRARCGKLQVEDCPLLPSPAREFIQHVAIDRFSGGAVEGALFSEEPVWMPGLELPLRVHISDADSGDAILLFQLLLDLGKGLLCVGNGRNRGNGRLQSAEGTTYISILNGMDGTISWRGDAILQGSGDARLQKLQTLAKVWKEEAEA